MATSERQYYYIKSKLSGYVLDIFGNIAFPGCQVGLWEVGDRKSNQMWRFDDETKTIRSEQANDYYVLDVDADDSLIVTGYDSSRSDQKWQRVGDKILNVDDPRYCIDVCESNTEKGARVIKYPFYETENQFWEFEPVTPYPKREEFYIVSQMHGKVVTVNAENKLEMQPKAATVDKNQLFFADADGYLHSAANFLALTSTKGDQFSLTSDSADPSNQWKFNAEGTRVVNADGNVLDIEGGKSGDGEPVVSWEEKDQVNQLWSKEVVA